MTRSPDADDDPSRELTRTSGEPSTAAALGESRFPPGTVLAGRYRIVALLGKGGMGEVYRAEDLRLRQGVALKLLPAALASNPGRLAAFHNEVRLARQVTHPNVCRVHDLGEAEGLTFLTMEHVDGEDLRSLLRRVGRLPSERAVVVARQICAGLAAAHEQGVLHRDLKPANVMIDGRGRARLTDFGLAIVASGFVAGLERAGTPAYMAPEQMDGGRISEQTDLYALGLVLYELFTGRRAFETDSLERLIEMRSSPPSAPTSHVPDLDPRIERVLLHCLESDPARRPTSAMAVAAALAGPDALAAAIAAGETPSPEMVAAAGEGTGLHPGAALALAALTVVTALAGLVLLDGVALVNQLPFDKPPEALAERARAILERIGISAPPADRAYGFAFDRRYVAWIRRHDRTPAQRASLSDGQPAAVFFWYRQSARAMNPYNDSGIVTASDPPVEPGMALVRLDTQGRLLGLLAPAERAAPPATNEAAWDVLLAEAGLERSALRPASDSWMPTVLADAIVAFDGTYPKQPSIPLRVEAAAWAGRPVAFRLRGPWDVEGPVVRSPARALIGASLAVIVPALLLGILLARRNLRLGRGDRRGAFRMAAFVLACALLDAVLRYGHASSPLDALLVVGHAVGGALLDATGVWILYVALEPFVRRRWPAALVSWSRLLSGRFRDPLVARDVLAASFAAAAVASGFGLAWQLPRWRGGVPGLVPLDAYLIFLGGPSRTLAWVFGFAAVMTLLNALANVLLFVLLRSLVRRTDAAALGLWALWIVTLSPVLPQLLGNSPSAEQWVLFSVLTAIPVFVLVRYGLLAMAVYGLMLGLLAEGSTVMRFGVWYAQPAVLLCAVAACVLGWGLYAALSTRPLHWDGLLES